MCRSNRNHCFLTFHANWIASSPIPTRMTLSVLITNNMISTVTLVIQKATSATLLLPLQFLDPLVGAGGQEQDVSMGVHMETSAS